MSLACSSCATVFPRWRGQCPICGAWNTITTVDYASGEGVGTGDGSGVAVPSGAGSAGVVSLYAIGARKAARGSLGLPALDALWSQPDPGMAEGRSALVYGGPGNGKSTILLQAALYRATQGDRVLWLTGEELVEQVRDRVDRIMPLTEEMHFHARKTNSFDEGLRLAKQYDFVVVDSLQTSLENTDEKTGIAAIRKLAKGWNTATKASGKLRAILIGHAIKNGGAAGPEELQHMVDAFAEFRVWNEMKAIDTSYREFRMLKNRDAPAKAALFKMSDSGFTEATEEDAQDEYDERFAAEDDE